MTSIFTDNGSHSGHFLLLYPALKNGDQTQKNPFFSKPVNIYNLCYLSYVHVFFSILGNALEGGDC